MHSTSQVRNTTSPVQFGGSGSSMFCLCNTFTVNTTNVDMLGCYYTILMCNINAEIFALLKLFTLGEQLPCERMNVFFVILCMILDFFNSMKRNFGYEWVCYFKIMIQFVLIVL